jgi:drug/metabolite transporter (DMT)-like permease
MQITPRTTSFAPRIKAYFLILIVTVIWGIASPVIKYTLRGFDPLTFLTYRFGISSIISIIIFLIIGFKLPKNFKDIVLLVIYGLLASSISLSLLFFGLKSTTVLDSSLITLSDPLLISIAGVYFLKEHISKREKIGISIAIIGTMLTIVEPLIQNGNGHLRLSGNLMIIAYAIVVAGTAVLGKILLKRGVEASTMTALSFILGFISLLPFFFASGSTAYSIIHTPYSYHLGVFYMAVISGSLAFYLSNKAQKSIEIGEQAIFGYMYPIFATPLAVYWLGEKITPIFVIGAVIIAIGVTIAEIKKKRYNSSSRI